MDRRKRYRQTVALMSMLSETKTIDNVDTANFDGNGANLLSLIVGVDPVQDLHGYDLPWSAGGGANLIPLTVDAIKAANGGANTWNGNSKTIRGVTYTILTDEAGNVTGINANGTATVSTKLNLGTIHAVSGTTYGIKKFNADDDVNFFGNINPRFSSATDENIYGRTTEVADSDKDVAVSYYIMQGGVANNRLITPFIAVTSTAPTVFTPYSNICPISGWTECNISHSGADTSDPTIYNIAFPSEAGTVYGGTLDVVRKKLTVNMENIPSYNGETLSGEWISDRDVYSVGGTPTIGAQVVYALASPVVYDLTNVPVIQTFEGENNIWADTGKIIFLEYEA